MAVACPCCKAPNTAGPACRRCKADLGLLFAVAAQADSDLARARIALSAGDTALAATMIDRALQARRTPEALKLQALMAYLGGDFPQALASVRSWESACAKSS